ncbi:MAG: DUF4157 domain-containing protein [Bacteroidetes bacterium]|nr:DUF4157 domain-containing protein [Bacteroidota bacterium]
MKKFKRIKPGKKNDERIISNNSSRPENEVKNPKSNHIQFLQKSLGNHATLQLKKQDDPNSLSQANQSIGRALPKPVRNDLETGLNTDLSSVRVHTGQHSDEAANSINANAFTKGNNIHFAQGQYDPNSPSGRKLIAHEVVHTMQQTGEVTQRRPNSKIELSKSSDPAEKEAERIANMIFSEEAKKNPEQNQPTIQISRNNSNSTRISRQEKPDKEGSEEPVAYNADVENIRSAMKVLKEWQKDLLADSANLASLIPHELTPGTQEYANAWQELFDDFLNFAYMVGDTYGREFMLSRDGLDPELIADLDEFRSQLNRFITWVGKEAYNELVGRLPRADVINMHIGPYSLPVPSKKEPTYWVLREGDNFPGGTLTRQWLIENGYVQASVPCAHLANYTMWVHPGTGDQVMLFSPLGTPKKRGVCIE